jgi:hypothetical protein
MPQIVFSGCNNTLQAMQTAEGKELVLVAEARIVPAALRARWSCKRRAGATFGHRALPLTHNRRAQ